MKLLTITLKDLTQSLRSAFAVVFMFVIPILVTGMFYFMFGGQSEGDEPAFSLPQIQVKIVNLDEGSPAFAQNLSAAAPEQLTEMGIDLTGVRSMGDILAQMLKSETFAELLTVSDTADAASARATVDSQQAGVAVIIPQNFTQASMASEEQAVIELYQDPALTLGQNIVKAILGSFLDNTAATRIGIEVVSAQLTDSGLSVDDARRGQIAMQFLTAAAEGQGSAQVEVRPLAGAEPAANPLTSMIAMIMGGMMIFYAFYTGTARAESILQEEERGTLPRLFTTPTPLWTILGGKFIASALMVLVQVSMLLVFGRLVFGIHWGAPLPVALAALGIVLSASSLGIFIISLLKNVKQTGVIFGGVLTITGMIGIFSVFTTNAPNAARITTDTLSLIVPQGWAMRSLRLAMEGASLAEFMPIMAGILAWSTVLFTIGILRFRKRYA